MNLEHLKAAVHCDPDILGGTPVFTGTRVPLQNFIDALEGGESVDGFLEGFPTVQRERALAVIEAGKRKMLEIRLEILSQPIIMPCQVPHCFSM